MTTPTTSFVDGHVEDLVHTTESDLQLSHRLPSTTPLLPSPSSPPLPLTNNTTMENPLPPPTTATLSSRIVTTPPLFTISEPWVHPTRSRFPDSIYETGSGSRHPTPICGMDQLAATFQAFDYGIQAPVLGGNGGLPPSFNITSIVTTQMATVEDYLTWRTQFLTLLISHGLLPYVDGSYPPPPPSNVGFDGRLQGNPSFYAWIPIDQTLQSWLSTTVSRDILIDIRDLLHASQIWERLHDRYITNSLAKSLELKRKFTNIKKTDSHSMEAYLRDVKIIADSLAAINSPLTDRELIEFTIFGLDDKYENMITAATFFGSNLSFANLRNKLIMYEQRVLHLHDPLTAAITHHALATTTMSPSSRSNHSAHSNPPQNRNNGYARGGRGHGSSWQGRQNKNYSNRGGGVLLTSAIMDTLSGLMQQLRVLMPWHQLFVNCAFTLAIKLPFALGFSLIESRVQPPQVTRPLPSLPYTLEKLMTSFGTLIQPPQLI